MQIIRDEGMIDGLKGQAIVITGISSGIGIETARALAATGANLFLTARNVSKARSALADFYEPQRMDIVEMDQADLSSVRQAASAILAKTSKVHLLVNNAGIMAIPDLRFTSDGHELQFGTNHLAHFLLFKLLEPALLAAASEALPSRVVVLSSSGHNIHGLNGRDNYNFHRVIMTHSQPTVSRKQQISTCRMRSNAALARVTCTPLASIRESFRLV
jgi:NAD(P)-dependent dehydrogenase (short-subunit alcohol dehydrogenase family)